MKGLGAKMAGGNPENGRQPNDFYATPADVTRALIRAEHDVMPHLIWEPACGTGAITEVLQPGRVVFSSDLNDYGYGGEIGRDFLDPLTEPPFWSAPFGIVTNPPFKLAQQFIIRAHEIAECHYLALVLKTTYWQAGTRRRRLWETHPPARIYALGWRPDFRDLGAPTMDCMWCVWEPRKPYRGTQYQLLFPNA